MKALKGFLVFILIAVIVGGVGYIGYSLFFMDHSQHNMASATTSQTSNSGQTSDSTNGSTQNQQNMQEMSGMQQNSSSSQSDQNNSQQASNNQIALNQSNIALQNKDNLNKTISTLNEAIKLMSLDPYAPSTNGSDTSNSMQTQQGSTAQTGSTAGVIVQGTTPADDKQTAAAQGNSTTINIYPQAGAAGSQQNSTNATAMSNMGTTYDANKMEQLHAGLYKISVGMALLDQLNSELAIQAENTAVNTQYPAQYYSYQYNMMVQNKNKLSEALTYINEAANLVNINPYVSSNGLVYDKDKMGQLHQSVYKLAAGVAALNQLSDDFTKQSINLSITAQNYINNAAASSTMNIPTMNMSSGLFGGLFDNISVSSIVNIILIIFVVGLIFGIFGFIFSLLKGSGPKTVNKEDTYS